MLYIILLFVLMFWGQRAEGGVEGLGLRAKEGRAEKVGVTEREFESQLTSVLSILP